MTIISESVKSLETCSLMCNRVILNQVATATYTDDLVAGILTHMQTVPSLSRSLERVVLFLFSYVLHVETFAMTVTTDLPFSVLPGCCLKEIQSKQGLDCKGEGAGGECAPSCMKLWKPKFHSKF